MSGNNATPAPLNVRLTCVLAVVALALLPISEAFAGARERAKAAAEKGDWKTAAEQYSLVLDERKADREAAIGLTEASIQAGLPEYYPAAEDALLVLRERNARDYDVLIALGQMSLAIAATKTNTLALKSYNDEALKSFEAAARIKPDSEAAAVGQARVHYESAFFDKAVEVVDAFLARKPVQAAKALFWKGQALYFLAGDAYRQAGGTGPLPENVKSLYTKAQGAYAASARANPKSYDTMIQLAYASAWIGHFDSARDAYRKAAVLDPSSVYPLKGIEALYQHDPEGLPKMLKAFVDEHPKHPQALWYLGYNRYAAKDWPAAIEYLKRSVPLVETPGRSWYYLGKAYEAQGEAKKAEKAFWKALEANPDDELAAWALEQYIQKTDPMARARQSVKGAQEVIAAYDEILDAAPRNYNARNNLGFTLREAYVAHQGDRKWLPILKASLKYYVEASEILGEFDAEKEQLPYATRHAMAQVISDTGLMFQFYKPTQDLEKALMYYERALEYSEDGYWDAYNNMRQILFQQKRWDELYDWSAACAEGIKNEKGEAVMRGRNSAKATMEKLLSEGKVSD